MPNIAEVHYASVVPAQIDELINNMDVRALAALESRWEALSLRGRHACLAGLLLLREPTRSLAALEKFSESLKSDQTGPLFWLQYAEETKSEFSRELHQALAVNCQSWSDFYLQGDYHFRIGLAFALQDNFALGKEFFAHSIEILKKTAFSALVWRSQFNWALCVLRLKEYGLFQQVMVELQADFVKLPVGAQAYLCRLLIWVLMYLDNFAEAWNLCRTYAPICYSLGRDSEGDYLLKYQVFLAIKMGKVNSLDHSAIGQIRHERERKIVQEFFWIVEKKPLTSQAGQNRIEMWSLQFDLMNLHLLIDALLHQLKLQNQADTIVKVVGFVERNAKHRFVIPHVDYKEYSAWAYLALGKTHHHMRVLFQLKETSPPWRQRNLQKSLHLLRASESKPLLVLDLNRKSLFWKNKEYELSRKPRMFRMIQEVFSHRKGCERSSLGVRLYEESLSPGVLKKLQILYARTNLLIPGIRLLEQSQDRLVVASEFTIVIKRSRSESARQRQHKILQHIHRSGKAGLSIEELVALLHIARRSLQSDLKHLVENGKLSRSGRARAVRYRAN